MRKETTGRLLLSLFTAFIMVAGALGAAGPAFLMDTDESPTRPVLDGADSEHDLRMSETGDALVSADANADVDPITLEPTPAFFVPGMSQDREGIMNPGDEGIIEETVERSGDTSFTDDGHGTRNPDTVYAGGPYGSVTPFVPVYEGDPITYEAEIEPEDELDNYQFRWDVNGDGVFDGPGDPADDYFGEYGENTFTNTFYDDFYGEVLVQAWDGSWKTVTFEGRLLDGAIAPTYEYYGTTYQTFGYTFEVTEEVTVTQLGNHRYNNGRYPYGIYNLRLWDESRTVIAEVLNPYNPAASQWNWEDITPVTLYPDETYMISTYIYYRYMPSCYDEDMPAQSEDGKIITGLPYRSTGNNYPTSLRYEYVYIDFNYEWDEVLPDVLEDTAESFILNRLPIVTNAVVSPDTTREGSEDAMFTGEMIDLGLDDEWEYQWDFGDGTQSEWLPIQTWEGGIKLLFLHGNNYPPTWPWYDSFRDPLLDLMGPHVTSWEMYDWSWLGNDAAPDLDYLMEFDVVLLSGFAVGSASGTHGDTGDVLADYVDAGGAVVQMQNSMGYDPVYPTTYGIEGRWRDEDYVTLTLPSAVYQASPFFYLNWWDPTHPIMDGPFGTVSSFGSLLSFNHMGVTPYANLLATYDNGHYAAAYTMEDHHGIPGSGRIVGLNWYAYDLTPNWDYMDGDGFAIVANALMWASQKDLAQKLSQPYPLPPISHIYEDDHPEHVTPSDQIQPSVRVRDDDHGAYVLLSETVFLEEYDWPGPSIYYPGQSSGWTDEHTSIYAWRRNNGNNAGGSPPEAYLYYYYARANTHFYSPAFDTSAFPTLSVDFKSYINHYSGTGLYTLHAGVSYDASTWTEIWSDAPGSSGQFDVSAPFMGGSPTTYFGFWVEGNPYYFNYWYVDNVVIKVQETWGPTEGMSDWMPSINMVTVENVFPAAINEAGVVLEVEENTPILMEGFRLTDPAWGLETEEHWYRWNFDDGTPLTDWTKVERKGAAKQKVLIVHGHGSGYSVNYAVDFLEALPAVESVDTWDLLNTLVAPTVDELLEYQVVTWICLTGAFSAAWDNARTTFGDNVADYLDQGGGFFDMAPGLYINSIWSMLGRYIDDGYAAAEMAPCPWNTGGLGTVYDPAHPIMNGVSTLSAYGLSGNHPPTIGGNGNAAGCNGVTLFDWTTGNPGLVYKELNNGAKTLYLNQRRLDDTQSGSGFISGDWDILVNNIIAWCGGAALDPVVPPFTHNFMDNGVYYVHLQAIDDDMYWDWAPTDTEPTFLGPNNNPDDPGADPMDWIGGTVFPVEIRNTDPVISPRMRAYAQLDLRLRISGTKDTDATMTLYETVGDETTVLGSAFVSRDPGAPNIGIMPSVELLLNKENTYELVVEVTGGSGGNPTWIFDMVFPDGKYKEFKHTFNDEHGWTWVIDNSMLKGALLGHDIIFEAEADDIGSDDLAFVWNFGDSTPHGIHLYANVDQGTAVDAVSDEATVIFDQLPDRDADFVKSNNDVRTPDGTPISAADTISHVFDADQPYYYYITLVVMDDDVGDDYPSTQLHPCPGCDMIFLEIDFR